MFKKRLILLFLCVILLSASVFAQYYDEHTTKNNIKFTLLSLGSGSTRITYERAITAKYSAELTVGIIGLGWDFLHHTYSTGGLVKTAFKWNIIPQKNTNSWLAGFYLKPEFVAAFFDYSPADDRSPEATKHTNQFALIAECGYQVVVKWFVFDVYTGTGLSFGTGNDYNYYHGFMLFPKNSPLAFTAGFRLGVAF